MTDAERIRHLEAEVSRLRSSPNVPEGYWLAPLVPTPRMIENVQKAQLGQYFEEYSIRWADDVLEIWRWLREASSDEA